MAQNTQKQSKELGEDVKCLEVSPSERVCCPYGSKSKGYEPFSSPRQCPWVSEFWCDISIWLILKVDSFKSSSVGCRGLSTDSCRPLCPPVLYSIVCPCISQLCQDEDIIIKSHDVTKMLCDCNISSEELQIMGSQAGALHQLLMKPDQSWLTVFGKEPSYPLEPAMGVTLMELDIDTNGAGNFIDVFTMCCPIRFQSPWPDCLCSGSIKIF